jgi:cytochrome P450
MRILETNFDDELREPFDFYDKLHNKNYHVCVGTDGTWGVFKYQDVERVLTDYSNFSAIGINKIMNPDWLDPKCHRKNLLTAEDPPCLLKSRRRITTLFSKRHVDSLVPYMREQAERLAANYPRHAKYDFMVTFSYPFISCVLNRFLGTNYHYSEIKSWIDAIESMTLKESARKIQVENAILNQRAKFMTYIEMRRKNPQSDFISKLIVEYGDVIDNDDLLDYMELAISSGFHTVLHLLTHILAIIIKDKALKQELTNNPALIPLFIDESLRMYPSVLFTMRVSLKDVDMHGYTIPQGKFIRPFIGAANRDPKVFISPNSFDIHRKNNNEHLAFGSGVHFCLGYRLAIAELNIALESMLRHFDVVRLPEKLENRVAIPTLLGYTNLEISIGQ